MVVLSVLDAIFTLTNAIPWAGMGVGLGVGLGVKQLSRRRFEVLR